MSRLTVRTEFEAEMNLFLAGLPVPVPFYSTINEEVQPRDRLWVTVEYFSDSVSALCYSGMKRADTGSIDVAVFAKAGLGYTDAITLAGKIEDHFLNLRLPGGIEILQSAGLDELTRGSGLPLYGVSVLLGYTQFH